MQQVHIIRHQSCMVLKKGTVRNYSVHVHALLTIKPSEMGIRGLTSQLRPLTVRKPPQAFADGTMFIDGHSMSHTVARSGQEGAMYDWRGVGLAMEMTMKSWLQAGWKIEMILFDGLTPREKMGVIDKRVRERIGKAVNSHSLSLAAACASVCQTTLVNKFPQINCKIAPGESDDLLASLVWNYATRHADTPTYLLTGDSDFCAFDFPNNVTLVNPQTYRGQFDSLNLTPQVTRRKGVPPSAYAYITQYARSSGQAVLTNPNYIKYANEQMETLKSQSIATHAEYMKDEAMMHSYKVLGEDNTFDQAAHRVINSLVASNELYMMMPIMCEPSESEFCFDAGRRWRSLAYEVIAQKEGGSKDMYFTEYGRHEYRTNERKIPITDGSREQNDRLEKYKYGSKESITKEINSWKTKEDFVQAIYNEMDMTTPSGEGPLKYSPEITKNAALAYLNEIVDSVGNKHRKEIYFKNRGKMMSPTALRVYNKFLACVMSLRLLQCAGFKLPVNLELYDMDGARWAEVVIQTSSPNHKRIDIRNDKPRNNGDTDDLSDQMRTMRID